MDMRRFPNGKTDVEKQKEDLIIMDLSVANSREKESKERRMACHGILGT